MEKTFTQTSDKLYDKHQYKITLNTGKSLVLDSYEEMYDVWRQIPDEYDCIVEVIDKKEKRLKKGFI